MSEGVKITTSDQLWDSIVESKLTENHLSLMNMNWWPTPPWEALAPYAQIARRVADNCDAIRPMIEERNWRINLYGVAIAVLSDATPLVDSMVDQVGQSWVSPQVAAGVSILLGGIAHESRTPYLEKLYRIATESPGFDESKFSMAAYAALRPWGQKEASDFEDNSSFLDKWRAGRKWYDLTKRHHERWLGVLPYLDKMK